MAKLPNKFTTLDNIKLHQKLHVNFACSYSDDQRVSILSENGVYILQLGCNSENRSPTFSFIKSFFPVPQSTYSIDANVDIDLNDFIDLLDQYDIYESLLNVNLSQNLKAASAVSVVPVSAQWSRKGIDNGVFCLLGVLTNTGVLEIVGRKMNACDSNEYYVVCNVTDFCLGLLKPHFKNMIRRNSAEEQLAELKLRVDKVRITAFTWGDFLKTECTNNGSYLFCGHGDGGISFLSISCDLVAVCKSYYNSSLKQITAMSWLNGGNSGLLIIGDLSGRISAIILNNTDNSYNFDETIIYSTCDNIKIEFIKQFHHNELMYILIVKETFVIIAIFNADCNFIDQKVFSCGNLAITGVELYENNTVLILTYTGVIKLLQLFCVDDQLKIENSDVSNDIGWKKYRAHGLFLSYNRVFVGLIVHPCHVRDFAKVNQFLTIVILRNCAKNPIEQLLKNSTGSLEYHWDCLEILRAYGLKHKKYPCEKYPFILKMNYDKLNILEIKTLLHISKISRVIYSKKVKDINRNIESVSVLNVIMQLKLVIKRLTDLIQLHSNGETLTQFQLNSIELADSYLKEIVVGKVLQKFGLTTYTANEIYDLMAYIRNMEFPAMPTCFWCKNTISGLNCFPPHADTRCAISFMQISQPITYYKCQFCKTTVHRTVVEEEKQRTCPFCDLLLQQTYFKGTLQEMRNVISAENDDFCGDDCLNEQLDAGCVEEEAFVDLDWFGFVPKACPNFDEVSISDASSGDESDVDYIFEKELSNLVCNELVVREVDKEMDVD